MNLKKEKLCEVNPNKPAGEPSDEMAEVIEGEFEVLSSVPHKSAPDDADQYTCEKPFTRKSAFVNADKRNNKERRQSQRQHLIETRSGDRRRHYHIDISV